jgi:cytochrome bd-type quinol oxidase subunit 2
VTPEATATMMNTNTFKVIAIVVLALILGGVSYAYTGKKKGKK